MKVSGTTNPAPRPYELRHREISRKAATEGFVLLKNDEHLLPIARDVSVALYGSGSVFTCKGGTGSGDVNCRETVNVWQGLKDAGYRITNEDWLKAYEESYNEAKCRWRDAIWAKQDAGENLWFAYTGTAFQVPTGPIPEEASADVAVYVLTRNAGEGADRFAAPGDWYLTPEEEAFLSAINDLYSSIILVVNTGGLVDLAFTEDYTHIRSILYVNQPGMEAGHAIADVLSGDVTPSGRLTDTWALHYGDYPTSATFSHNNGNTSNEYYEEGRYVGYRYFDTFQVPVRYCFGYGLSYTEFEFTGGDVKWDGEDLVFTACIRNSGDTAGREVVQVYASLPDDVRDQPYRRLIGFGKTALLESGATELLEIRVPLRALASYDAALPGWVLDAGVYVFFMGDSLDDSSPVASLRVPSQCVLEKTQNICPLQEELSELLPDPEAMRARRAALMDALKDMPELTLDFVPECRSIAYGPAWDDMPEADRAFVDTLSLEQLVELATGDIAKGQGSQLGNAGSRVPGSAAQTSACAVEQGLADLVLADGPAGLRLDQKYAMLNGVPQKNGFAMALENGFLYRGAPLEGEIYYQYSTAIPVGTVLAQSWNPDLVRACGILVAHEMQEFGVDLWLAPGMNIHRNPLCGRNFEYYSEDPVLSGVIAAAMSQGVQSLPGCGVTIKHFACNNQEDNRTGSDSVVAERTLREIYLLGFEIAVKTGTPASIMTSYNLINGVHAANNYDLCTSVVRNEWGYKGVIMTDWTTTSSPDGKCSASGCMHAGNDLVMPGAPEDHQNIRDALEKGTLDLRDLKRSIARLVTAVRVLTDSRNE